MTEFHENIDHVSPDEFHSLCEAALEESLTPEQLRVLEQCVFRHHGFRQYYVEHVQQHLALSDWAETRCVPNCAVSRTSVRQKSREKNQRRPIVSRVGLISSLLLVSTVSFFFVLSRMHDHVTRETVESRPQQAKTESVSFATLQERGICVWGESDHAEEGRIGQSELHLVSGIAQIYFDNGVILSLESPVKLDVLSPSGCYLHSGKVIARVSPEGVGFTVETPVAKIEDLGTEFGVNVQEGQDAEVQVFSGLVDVHRETFHDKISVHSGGRLQFKGDDDSPYNPNEKLPKKYPQQFSLTGTEAVCTTDFGRGKEAFVLSGGKVEDLDGDLKSDSSIYLLIKNASESDFRWHRKAWFTFDTAAVPTRSLSGAKIELAFGPTGVGFRSRLLEKTHFVVYGFRDESCDDWDAESINWENAPGNLPGPAEIDPSKAVVVGEFDIDRDEQSVLITITGETLNQLIASDTNDLLTFVVVSETEETLDMGYAHGFANRHHPELPPPTLRLAFENENIDESTAQQPEEAN